MSRPPPSEPDKRISRIRFTQRTIEFIRWLKNHLHSKLSWAHPLARLARIYARS